MTIVPLTYLGGVEWFVRLAQGDCVIDVGENWVKQTARNRAEILTAGGVATLTVPVHGYGGKIATRDVRIDNSKRWQHTHWISIVSAYRGSPFFDHYEERFAPIYARRFDFLLDLNRELLDVLLQALRLDVEVRISENYVVPSPGDLDLRGKKAFRRVGDATAATVPGSSVEASSSSASGSLVEAASASASGSLVDASPAPVSPSSATTLFTPCDDIDFQEYTQVFSDRMAFMPGLSAIDLLFCEGPSAREFLR